MKRKTITIELPDDLLEDARRKATEERRSLSSMIEEGLEIILSSDQSGREIKADAPARN